jgi:hypothetical protein
MMIRINTLIILAICVFIAFPAVAAATAADDPSVIGTIEEVEGSATMTRPNQAPVAAAIDMPVHMNDVIETAQGSKADILFIDETEITLGENARLGIDEYVFDPDNMNGNKGRFSIPQGAFQFVTGQIDKIQNPDVKIGMAYGAVGVRGTTVIGSNVDNAYGVFVQDGAADVINNGGTVRLNAGQGTSLTSRNAAPAAARVWSPDKISRVRTMVHLRRAALVRQRVAQHKMKFAQIRQQRHLLRQQNLQKQPWKQRLQKQGNMPWQQKLKNGKLPFGGQNLKNKTDGQSPRGERRRRRWPGQNQQ